MPSRPSAWPSIGGSTSSAVEAMTTGVPSVSTTDVTNVPASSATGVCTPVASSTAIPPVSAAPDPYVAAISRRRSTRSAMAPAWSDSRNPGSAHSVCTSPMSSGESVSWAIDQPAAVICTKEVRFIDSAANHSVR